MPLLQKVIHDGLGNETFHAAENFYADHLNFSDQVLFIMTKDSDFAGKRDLLVAKISC